MTRPLLHADVTIRQRCHPGELVCGDVVRVMRIASSTTVILADGIRKGINANLAAEMAAARLAGLLHAGFSLRNAMQRIARTMEGYRNDDDPFAAVAVLQFRPTGACVMLVYAAPPPILVQTRRATPLAHIPIPGADGLHESRVELEPGDDILLMSDGVTESGMGPRSPGGWREADRLPFINRCYEAACADVAGEILDEACARDAGGGRDDATVVRVHVREARVAILLSGPCANPQQDDAVVRRFLGMDGVKIVCGGTTASIVARVTGRTLKSTPLQGSPHGAPPGIDLDGIDLATEGIMTLNQTCNVLSSPDSEEGAETDAERLAERLRVADRIHILAGGAQNPANENRTARRLGIQPRRDALLRLQGLLEGMGKLVIRETV